MSSGANHHRDHQFDDLPKEIKFDILSRLPVQTLAPCRFVSKDWFNLIKDPIFVDLHHSHLLSSIINNNGDDGGNLLVVGRITVENKQEFYLLEEDDDDFAATFNSLKLKPLNIKLDIYPSNPYKLIGSFNGLVCMSMLPGFDIFYIFNPVTREVLQLPEPLGVVPNCNDNLVFMYTTSSGFAYHTPTGEYKLVRSWYYIDKDSFVTRSGIDVYTVGSRSIWRRIETEYISGAFVFHRMPVPQVFLNGALHWKLDEQNYCICALHIGDGKLTKFEAPPVGNIIVVDRTLLSLQESLCLTDQFFDYIVIWIMKSYELVESWAREHVIRNEIFGPLQSAPYFEIKTLKSGIILLRGDEYHGYYDFEKKEFKQILMDSPIYNLDVCVHLGSLISPSSIAGKGEEYQVPFTTPRTSIGFSLKRKAEKPLSTCAKLQV